MSKIVLIIICSIFNVSHNYAQLQLEGIVSTGMNMSIFSAQRTIHSPYEHSTPPLHFVGANLGINLGGRLMLLEKRWSLGLSLGYQFKYHEANSIYAIGVKPNSTYPFHFFTIPFDINYNFKNKIGLHLGGGLDYILAPRTKGNVHQQIQNKVIPVVLVGISYTKGRFRFELLYKHHFNYYMKRTFTYQVANVSGTHTDYTFTRFHDIQFRIAVRLFTLN